MSTLFKSSSRTRSAAPMLLATIACSFLALHCSSDDAPTGGTSGTGNMSASGSGSGGGGGGSPAGAGGSSAGMATAGMPAAGSPTGGSATAGAAGTSTAGAGMGGASGGAGGSGGGAGGSAAGAGGSGGGSGGGNGATFAQVKTILAMSCATGQCHVAGNPKKHMDWGTDTAGDSLYKRLTTAIPQGTAHCAGTVPVVAGKPDESFLVKVIQGQAQCGNEMIVQMPDDCPKDRPCLTADKIKVIKDWVSAGAPM